MDRHLFDHWLSKAEELAKVPKLSGGLGIRIGGNGQRNEKTYRSKM